MSKRVCVLLTAVFTAFIAQAANTWYVDCRMADYTGHDGKSREQAYRTIMEAVAKASSGDTIWVHPGTYNSGTGTTVQSWGWARVGWNNKKLFLRSTGGAEKTIIEGEKNFDTGNGGSAEGNGVGAMRCFSLYNNDASTHGSVIQGFTFKGGATVLEKDPTYGHQDYALFGGGTCIRAQQSAFFVDCIYTDCTARSYGAAATYGTFIRCRFTENTSYPGGYLFYGGGSAASRIQLYACVLDHNYNGVEKSTSSGIMIYGALAVNCTILENYFKSCCYSANEFFYNTILWVSGAYNANCTYVNCLKQTDERYPIMSTMFTDTRIKAGSAAIGAGDGAHLAELSIPQEVIDLVGLKDYGGNDVADAGAINAGANQSIGAPAAGGIAIGSTTTRVNGGKGVKSGSNSYVFPDTYPTQYLFSAAVDDPAKRLSHFHFAQIPGYSPEPYDYRFPSMDDTLWVMPPADVSCVLTNSSTTVAPRVYVAPDADAMVAIGSEALPYRTIQDAIDATSGSVTIIAKPGLYAEGFVDNPTYGRARILVGRTLRITSEEGAASTILMGAPSADPTADEHGRGPGAVRCIVQNSSMTQIQGFTLTGGRTDKVNDSGLYNGLGGAVCNSSSYLTVDDCIITNNYAYIGGAVRGGRLNRCYIADNHAASYVFYNTTLCGSLVEKNHLSTPVDGVLGSSYRVLHTTVVGERVPNAHPYATATTGRRFASVFLRGDTARDTGIAVGNVYGEMLSVADQTGGIAANPFLADPDNGAFEPLAFSPVFTCGEVPAAGNYGDDYWFFARTHYNGEPIRFINGKPVAGAFATPTAQSIVALDATQGGISPSFSRMVVTPQETITFTETDGTRPCIGLLVNGVTNRFDEHGGEIVLSGADASAGGIAVAALYTRDWYVDAVNGSDAHSGFYPGAAKRTLAGVLDYTRVERGDIVHAAPGIYNQGTMKHDAADEVSARAVLTNDLTLVAEGTREETIIEGKAADIPDDSQFAPRWGVRGCGEGAVKCVRMLAGSRIKGFTIRNGFTRLILGSSGEPSHGHSDTTGGGLSASGSARSQCWAEDCLVTNCAAYRGGGMMAVNCRNCLFADNLADYGGGAASDCKLYNCITRDNLLNSPHNASFSGILYCYEIEGCTILDGWNNAPNCLVRNSLFAGYANLSDSGTVSATNCVFNAALALNISDEWLESCKDSAKVDAGSLIVDDEGRPVIGRNIAVDAADSSVVTQPCDRDFYGLQRVWNNTLDIGAMDADWRPVYAEDISKSRRFQVVAADPAVEESAARSVKIPPEASLEAVWRAEGGQRRRYAITAAVTGTGTLSVALNGAILDTLAGGGEQEFVFANDLAENALVFSYAGADGYAEIVKISSSDGMALFLR